MREWIWRIKAMLQRDRLTAERREELQAHLDLEIDSAQRQGLSLQEAKRRARLRVGLVSQGLETSREEFGFRWLDGAISDLRHAFRALLRNRGFGLVAVLVLSASVAINTLIFCMLEGVILRPLPYRSPKRLVRLYDASTGQPKFPLALGRFLYYRSNSKSIESMALYTGRDMELTASAGHSQQLTGVEITGDYFSVLGKPPFLGRSFSDADLHHGIRNAIISHRLWRDYFRSDPNILGKPVRLNREAWTIVGVASEGFQHVGGDYRSPLQGETVDVWMPIDFLDAPEQVLRAFHYCNAVARIREGFTRAQASRELAMLAASYSRRYPDYGVWTARVAPLLDEVTGRSRQVVWLLAAAGGLVMVVACANIAGLCVARAVSRRKELSLRRALGASAWQLLRVGLAENLLIAVAGSALGLLFARVAFPLLHQLLPADFPRAHEISLTWISAVFAVTVSMIAVLIAGVLPWGGIGALESQRVTSSRDSRRLRAVLVAAEVALAGLLCAGALFLFRSYREINARDHGFNAAGALTFKLNIPINAEPKRGSTARLYDQILTRIKEISSVSAVGATTNLPWSGYDENTGFEIVGRPSSNQDTGARYQAATPGYFEAAGMRLLDGRLFDGVRDANGRPATLIVNNALVKRYFSQGNAVGASLKLNDQAQIVGVVAGIQDSPADMDIKPALWFPLEQVEDISVFFVVRTSGGDPLSLTPSVSAAVHAVDPELAIADIRTLESHANSALAARRFALWLFQAFAILTLVLAAAGIYALLAYVVQQRSKELGIRVALGAARGDLWRMILFDGFKMAAAGIVISLLLIPFGGSLMQSFLYNVKSFDLFALAGAPAALLTVAIIASLGPARSAMRSDPALTLRED
ncbi:MAG: ABC transporter permease [Acidobacteriota bacterium]|nr:ABC transporter permease [Acidobacteriota bacterium]